MIDNVTEEYEMEKILSGYYSTISPREQAMLIIDGSSLAVALRPGNIKSFMKLAMKVGSVCCCRCSPSQKSQIATAVKKCTKNRVLAVGDGGNDVGMIRISDIGVGISGKEGVQAALAADFSITSFNHLLKLVLWHGRVNYKRICMMCHFVIHRGLIISMIQFTFTVIFHMVDLPLFNGVLITGYCTVFTVLPVFALILDVDIDYETTIQYPLLYKNNLKGRRLGTKMFLVWFLKAIYQGTSIMFCGMFLFQNSYITIVSITFTSLIFTELLNTITTVNQWRSIPLWTSLALSC